MNGYNQYRYGSLDSVLQFLNAAIDGNGKVYTHNSACF